MGYGAYVEHFTASDYHTETAGTVIDEAIQGREGERLVLLGYDYLAAATAHTMSFMYPGSSTGTRNTTSATAASGQKVMNVTNAPLDPAGNATASGDIIAYQLPTGVWEFNTVASLATLAITLTTNIAISVAASAKVRIFGIVADGAVHNIGMTASIYNQQSGHIILINPYVGDPWYVSADNATNAGFLNSLLFGYINK